MQNPQHKETFLNGALVVVAICAVAMTCLAVYRSFNPKQPLAVSSTSEIKNWEAFSLTGHRMGAAKPTITIVEFSDFQCPFCKRSAKDFHGLLDRYPSQLAVVYRHYPLENLHPVARQAAFASECAARQGAFERFHDVLYTHQDSLGLITWSDLAQRAQVARPQEFLSCLSDTASVVGAIERDIVAGEKLGVRGTPTIMINGHLLNVAATPARLDSIVSELLRGIKRAGI